MSAPVASPRRLLSLLVLAGLAAACVFGARAALPWLWARLFPTPQPAVAAEETPAPDRETVALALDQAVVAAGGELPPRSPDGEQTGMVALPRSLAPRDLEAGLRADPRLAGSAIYVTRADALLWSLRVFAGPELLMKRELRPWLPASPPHPPGNPPELVALVDLRDAPEAEVVLSWGDPVAVVLAPFAPPTLRLARDAAKASHAVVGALRADEPVEEQLRAIPHISAVLMESALPESVALDAFLAPLAAEGLTLVDGCARGCFDFAEVQAAGVPLLRVAAWLGERDGAAGEGDLALARNLAVQWGYGVVQVAGTERGLDQAEGLLESAKQDGLRVVFVEEAGRLHGLAPLPGG